MQDRVTDLGSTRRRPVQGITAQRRTRKIGSENELSLFRGRARGRRPGVAPGCRHLQAQQRGQNPVGRPARERNLPLAGAVLVDGTEKKDDSAPVRESGQKRISGLGRSPRELAATGGRRNQPGPRWRCARQTGTRPEDCHQDEKDRSDAAVTPSNCRRPTSPRETACLPAAAVQGPGSGLEKSRRRFAVDRSFHITGGRGRSFRAAGGSAANLPGPPSGERRPDSAARHHATEKFRAGGLLGP